MTAGAALLWWNQMAAAWLESAAHGLLTVVIISALCALVGRYLTASLRCWLWWLVCARLAFALVGGLLGAASFRVPLSLTLPAPYRTPITTLTPFHRGSGVEASADLPDRVDTEPTKNNATGFARAKPLHPSIAAYVLLLWSSGTLIALAATVRASWRLHCLLRASRDLSATPLGAELREMAVLMGVPTPPGLVETEATSAPFVAGLRRPVVVVPIGFTESLLPEEVRMALAHELAHVRRGDLYLALVPLAVRIFCFCIPFLPTRVCEAWATAREVDCDARAIAATKAAPGVYSRLLVKIVRGDFTVLPATLATLGATASFHTLQTRLQLIRARSGRHPIAPIWMLLFTLLALGAVFPWHLSPTFAGTTKAENKRALPLAPLVPLPAAPDSKDVADVPAFDTFADADPDKRYLLIGARTGVVSPPEGYRLLIVLPGGDGGPNFNPFVRRLRKHALGKRYLVAELVAKPWDTQQFQEVVWPTQTNPWPTMRFSTEQFVNAVVRDVGARFPIDRSQVFTLAWASGGPAGYAASLAPDTLITGSFVAMSIFPTDALASLSQAKGHSYFLLHPENAPLVPVAVAKRAQTLLRQNGADVEVVTYPGGYGWNGDMYAQVRRGVHYLEERTMHKVQ